jgi:ABC-2 type transport system ATP-binding protein
VIEIAGLTKTYGRGAKAAQALRGIDLEIQSGMFGLLGPNGAGKTTLMRILAGIVNPSRGAVRVEGHDLTTERGKRGAKAILGYLPQELGMYPELTAAQFVDYMAILKGMDEPRQRERRVAQVLEMVALEEAAHRKIKGFSGGMKRRVGSPRRWSTIQGSSSSTSPRRAWTPKSASASAISWSTWPRTGR